MTDDFQHASFILKIVVSLRNISSHFIGVKLNEIMSKSFVSRMEKKQQHKSNPNCRNKEYNIYIFYNIWNYIWLVFFHIYV